MKGNKGRQNSEITNFAGSAKLRNFWMNGMEDSWVDTVQFHHVSQESEEREILNILIMKKKW